MKTQQLVSLCYVVLAVFFGIVPATAWNDHTPALGLQRDVSASEVVAGEVVHVTLTVQNDAPHMVEYTLIEDVVPGVHVQATGKGSYNRAAGFIVWRGQLHSGARASHTYTWTAEAAAPDPIPLFAVASTPAGQGAEHAHQVTRHHVAVGWEIKESHVIGAQPAAVTLRVDNPLPRPLTVSLPTVAADGLAVGRPWPEQITLAPLAAWRHETTVTPAADGTYTMTVQPVVGGYAAGDARTAAVTRFAAASHLTENKGAASDRDDLVLLHPAPGHVFGQHEHMTLSLEAPAQARVTVFVNDRPVADDRLGYAAVDPLRERYTAEYVAVPLQSGANEVTARAVLPDGTVLYESVVVHRAGAVSRITVEPTTPLITGQWRPLVVRLGAYDDNDLPVADGTVLTVRLIGGTIVSPDAHPGWQGHQVVVRDGYARVEIAPPGRATAMTLHATGGKATVQKTLSVVAHADEWFVLGQGRMRLSADGAGPPTVRWGLRFVARGPIGSGAVLTAAADSDGFDAHAEARDVWTGATGETGSAGGDTGSFFVRWERGLSYVQFAHDREPFDGRLLRYDDPHPGVQALWHGARWELRSFVGRAAVEALTETFAGDGTGFFPLAATHIVPFSEQVTVQHRAPMAPYEIIHVRSLIRSHYYMDYDQGHVILGQPLARTDEAGNTLHLHVSYRVAQDSAYRTVGGVQWVGSGWRATALQTMATAGYERQHAGLASVVSRDGLTAGMEIAHSFGEAGSGFGVAVYGRAEDVLGWQATADGRFISEHYEPLTVADVPGAFAGLTLERDVGAAASVFAKTAYARPTAGPVQLQAVAGTRWSGRNVRPEAALVLTKEGDGPALPAARTQVAVDYANGAFVWQHQMPLGGGGPAAATLQGQHSLTPGLALHVTMDTERTDPKAPPLRRLSWGLTQSMTSATASTQLRGGVETVAGSGAAQTATVVGAETSFALSPHHSVSATWDHRRPWASGMPGFGGTLGWTYEYGSGESTLRYDHRVDEGTAKQAFTWRGVHAVGEALLLQGEALLTAAAQHDTTLQLKMSGVYRGDGALAVLSVAGQRQPFVVPGTTWEFRVQTAYEPVPNWLINVGGARRSTAARTVTDKLAIGTVIRLSDYYAVQAQLSHTRQHDTASSQSGTMVGVSRQLLPDVWLTVGYGSKQYVGLQSSGDGFAKAGGGPFLELTFVFDEISVLSLFSPRRPLVVAGAD